MATSTTSGTPTSNSAPAAAPSSSTGAAGSDGSAPSMLAAHAKYVGGAVSSALGYESGEQTKSAAVDEMRAAKSDEPVTQSGVLGSVEKAAGSAFGCEGMEEEGAKRQV